MIVGCLTNDQQSNNQQINIHNKNEHITRKNQEEHHKENKKENKKKKFCQ